MKKYHLIIFIFFLPILALGQQITNPPVLNFELEKINVDSRIGKEKIENLKVLGIIWGFLKYHHPNIAAGQFNMDEELFKMLPKYLLSENSKVRDEILFDWIRHFGSFEVGNEQEEKSDLIMMLPDLNWINHSKFPDSLYLLLLSVQHSKRAGSSYYVDLAEAIGNPVFKNEEPYDSMSYPNAAVRLLALYRYWNMIQYFYPYKNLFTTDWKEVLTEFIPKFLYAKNEIEYRLSILELIGKIHDTHANIWGKDEVLDYYRGLNCAPYEINFIENKAVVTALIDNRQPDLGSLQKGDIITEINHCTIEKILADKLKFYPASNRPTQLRDIAYDLLRTNDSLIQVKYIRGGKKNKMTLKTYSLSEINLSKIEKKRDTCYKLIQPEIGYLYPGTIKKEYLPDIWKDLEKTKGLIIDLRCYPSAFIVYKFGAYLMPESSAFAKFSIGSIETPGLFKYTESTSVGYWNDNYYKGKIVILVNEKTQSQAEFTTMAFRVAPNVKVIGSTTAGADGDISKFHLPGGILTAISGIGVYYPDGRETQRVGIIPDIELKPTIEGIRLGKDELVEKAIELINEE